MSIFLLPSNLGFFLLLSGPCSIFVIFNFKDIEYLPIKWVNLALFLIFIQVVLEIIHAREDCHELITKIIHELNLSIIEHDNAFLQTIEHSLELVLDAVAEPNLHHEGLLDVEEDLGEKWHQDEDVHNGDDDGGDRLPVVD